MNLKKLILGLFLMPFAIASKIIDLQIQELKKNLYEKEQELAQIIEKINEKENVIDSMMSKAKNVFPFVIEHLDDQEEEQLKAEMDSFEINLQRALINKKFSNLSLSEDFSNKNKKSAFELKRLKYLIIRYTFEYVNLKKLIEQYESYLQEILEFKSKLDELQK